MREVYTFDSGYYIIGQAMPYPLANTNVYLTESSDGWTVIDAGIDSEETRARWRRALADIGISFSHIKRICVTHCHPDHLGAAAWLQKESGAPVFMSERDINTAQQYFFYRGDKYSFYRDAIRQQLENKGFPVNMYNRLVDDWCNAVAPLYPEPEYIVPVNEGDAIEIHGEDFEVISASGHTDGQIVLWSEGAGHLFLADVFSRKGYLHFTEWPNTLLLNPLAELYRCLDILSFLEIKKVFPGHGEPFDYPVNDINRLKGRHRRFLELVAEKTVEPVTPGKLYRSLFNIPESGDFADYIHLHRVLVGETWGYLAWLAENGEIRSYNEEGVTWYTSVS